MIRILTLAALGLVGPSPPPAQPVSLPVQQDEAETAAERFSRLEAEATEAMSAWRKNLSELRKAAAEGGPAVPEEAWLSPYTDLVPHFSEAASEYAGTTDAIPFLVWLASNATNLPEPSGKIGVGALRDLLTTHASSPQLEDISYLLGRLDYHFGDEEARELLAGVEKKTTSTTVRAWAIYARLTPTLDGAAVDSEEFQAAKRELLAAMEGVEDRYLTTDASNKIEVRERFSLGMVAPDIKGVDLDGTAFSLSDYEGKVLFVDFWGDW